MARERRLLRHVADGALQLARSLVEGEGATHSLAESAITKTSRWLNNEIIKKRSQVAEVGETIQKTGNPLHPDLVAEHHINTQLND